MAGASDSSNIIDATPAQVIETAKKVMIDPQPQDFEKELANTVGATVGRKKPRRKRPKSKRGHGKPTGFEEYYAEGPITPAKSEELRKVYDPVRPFMDRIEDALVHYQYDRRIEPERRNIFHKFLQYGGVNAGQNFGQGVNDKDLKNMTPAQAMQARSQTSIQQEREKLEINFNTVVKGFLGSFYMRYFNPEDEFGIKLATVTIRNFFTYLLFHDVCPEYEENLLEARETCSLATLELPKNLELIREAPEQFNHACACVFGDTSLEATIGTTEWEPPEEIKGLIPDIEIIKLGISNTGDPEQAYHFKKLFDEKKIETKQILDIDGFEVMSTWGPTGANVAFYGFTLANGLSPLGKVFARSYRDPAKPSLDLSPEREEWENGNVPGYDFEFIVDFPFMELFYPGLKVMATVWEVNFGFHYFSDVISVYPTFYTPIANDLMLEWKWPKDLTDEEVKKSDGEVVQKGDLAFESAVMEVREDAN